MTLSTRILRMAGLALGLAGASVQAAPVMEKPAPELAFKEQDGQTIDLAQLRGKVVLVNFWATWCVPCRKELPMLNAFYRARHEQGLEVIGISIDRPEDLRKVRKAVAPLAYPTALLNDLTRNGFGAPDGVPITYVIDSDGVVKDRFIEIRDELLNGVVIPLLPH